MNSETEKPTFVRAAELEADKVYVRWMGGCDVGEPFRVLEEQTDEAGPYVESTVMVNAGYLTDTTQVYREVT